MLDAILKNPTLMNGVLGGIVRMIPPAVWKQLVATLEKGVAEAQAIRATLDRIEAKLGEHGEKIEFLETVCRSGIPDAGVLFAEREMYQPDKRTHVAGIDVSDIRAGGPR